MNFRFAFRCKLKVVRRELFPLAFSILDDPLLMILIPRLELKCLEYVSHMKSDHDS